MFLEAQDGLVQTSDDGLVLVETAAGVGEDELKEKTGVAFKRR